VYDLYYVKYDGKSEFGVDKGYGKDFMKLSQQLCIFANMSGAKCSGAQIANASTMNKINQDKQVESIANDTAIKTAMIKEKAKKDALEKRDAIAANNSDRIVPINIELVGFGAEYIGKEEKSALEDGEDTWAKILFFWIGDAFNIDTATFWDSDRRTSWAIVW